MSRPKLDPNALHGTPAPSMRPPDQQEGFRPTGDDPQGSRFTGNRPYPNHRLLSQADASYQGYAAYAALDGSRVDDSEFADIDWAGPLLEPERPAHADEEEFV